MHKHLLTKWSKEHSYTHSNASSADFTVYLKKILNKNTAGALLDTKLDSHWQELQK